MAILQNLVKFSVNVRTNMELHDNFETDTPIVTIPSLGRLKGKTSLSYWKKRTIYEFACIRYGEPPKGHKKYQKAEAVKAWTGTLDTRFQRPFCVDDKDLNEYLQFRDGRIIEDCLFLSVFSPNLSAKAPVMFYIGSSGYFDDKTEKSPAFLLEKNVVLVVPSYRTGHLGFFSGKSDDIPGNAGLTDIVLALEWVQKNIEHFGGCAGSVTVFGQGFGAALVDGLLVSPEVSEDLFDQAIMQSGSLLCPWAFEKCIERQIWALQWITGHGRSNLNIEQTNKVILDTPTADLLKKIRGSKCASSNFEAEYIAMSKLTPGGYGKLPKDLVKAERKRKPLMIGVTINDGSLALIKAFNILRHYIDTENEQHNYYVILHHLCDFLGLQDPAGGISGLGAHLFFENEKEERMELKSMFHRLKAFCGMVMFKAPVFRTAQLHAQTNPDCTFAYTFDYKGKVNDFENTIKMSDLPFKGGVYHSYENVFLFPTNDLLQKMSFDDLSMAKKMVDFWTSFAMTGVPSAEHTKRWQPFTGIVGPVYHLDSSTHITKGFPQLLTAIKEIYFPPLKGLVIIIFIFLLCGLIAFLVETFKKKS